MQDTGQLVRRLRWLSEASGEQALPLLLITISMSRCLYFQPTNRSTMAIWTACRPIHTTTNAKSTEQYIHTSDQLTGFKSVCFPGCSGSWMSPYDANRPLAGRLTNIDLLCVSLLARSWALRLYRPVVLSWMRCTENMVRIKCCCFRVHAEHQR